MTSNVLPLHFALSQASSSQNSNVDDILEGYKIKSGLPYKIFSTLLRADSPFEWVPEQLSRFLMDPTIATLLEHTGQ